ncbi:MAG: hypothetical protein WBL21_09695 [Salinimicrobium sp.]
MEQQEKKKKLLDILNKKAFNPILDKSKDDYDSEDKKKKLEEVQQNTKSKKERFENYNTPEEVRENYLHVLSSEKDENLEEKLKDLDLPRLSQIKKEFLDLCKELDVKQE